MYILFVGALTLLSCTENQIPQENTLSKEDTVTQFTAAMRKHLDAVEHKNIEALQATMSPDNELYFMLDKRPLSTTSASFMDFHKAWFKDTTSFTITFKILHTTVGDSVGIAITESMYREPNRDGKPYWNKMNVSYALKKVNGQWYVVKDHATSIAKSTD